MYVFTHWNGIGVAGNLCASCIRKEGREIEIQSWRTIGAIKVFIPRHTISLSPSPVSSESSPSYIGLLSEQNSSNFFKLLLSISFPYCVCLHGCQPHKVTVFI